MKIIPIMKICRVKKKTELICKQEIKKKNLEQNLKSTWQDMLIPHTDSKTFSKHIKSMRSDGTTWRQNCKKTSVMVRP